MPDITQNLGLKKPLGNESVSRSAYNENLEIIDQSVSKKSDLAAHLADDATGAHKAANIITASGGDLQTEINNLKSSASSGKDQIAAAITGMGRSASGSDTFTVLAAKIGDISKDADAAVANVLTGKTFYQGGLKKTGTMPNRGAVNITPGSTNQAIQAGYHNGSGIVQGSTNLVASSIKEGVNIFGVVGNVVPDITSISRIQRGRTQIPSNDWGVGATISAVDPSKAVLTFSAASGVGYARYSMVSGYMSSNTAISFHTDSNIGSTPMTIDWEVIEFNKASVQKGYMYAYVGNPPITISAVNLAKSFIICSSHEAGIAVRLTSSTTLETTIMPSNSGDGFWFVVTMN